MVYDSCLVFLGGEVLTRWKNVSFNQFIFKTQVWKNPGMPKELNQRLINMVYKIYI
jgi:hypothetical protein